MGTNNYRTNDDDLVIATDGYRNKENVCYFFNNKGSCYKGNFCEDLHSLPRRGAVTADVDNIIIETLDSHLYPQKGTRFLSRVSQINSPSSFYISFPYGGKCVLELTEASRRNVPKDDEWTHLETNMTSTYKESRKYFLDDFPTPGSLVAVKYEGRWLRALVVEDISDVSIELFLVDSGVTKTALLKDIRKLDPSFSILPYKVVEAGLNLDPNGSQWSQRSTEKFQTICGQADYIVADICGTIGDKIIVNLTCSSNVREQDIANLLCLDNLAIKSKQSRKKEQAGTKHDVLPG